jgi:hypothetical protein
MNPIIRSMSALAITFALTPLCHGHDEAGHALRGPLKPLAMDLPRGFDFDFAQMFDGMRFDVNFEHFGLDLFSPVDGSDTKDKPYSTEVVTESNHILADGNRISRKTVSKMARDREGRFRQEALDGASRVYINDPVAKKTIILDVEAKTATVHPNTGLSRHFSFDNAQIDSARRIAAAASSAASTAASEARRAGQDVAEAVRKALRASGIDAMGPQSGRKTVDIGAVDVVTLDGMNRPRVSSNTWMHTMPSSAFGMNSKYASSQEPLGTKLIEGVNAEGMRRSTTIPAGEIGNEKPIVMTSELWKAPDLNLTLYSRNADPRTGETIYRLHNLSRNDPPASLFTIPEGYKIKETAMRVKVIKS